MTKAETARILTLIAAFDRRTIGETDVEAWHLILGDLDPEDCATAVREHYTHRRDWLMPADVRSYAVTAQRRREGQTRLAAIERQVQAENPPAELHARPVAALTAGQPMPAARLMRTEVASRRRQDTEADVAARTRVAEAREQARRELEQVRAASSPPAPSETAVDATASGSTEATT